MSENEKILVVVEPENHPYEVVERASWLADLTNCDLHLVLCDPDIGLLNTGIFISNEARDLAGWMCDVIDSRGDDKVIAEVKAKALDLSKRFPVYA